MKISVKKFAAKKGPVMATKRRSGHNHGGGYGGGYGGGCNRGCGGGYGY